MVDLIEGLQAYNIKKYLRNDATESNFINEGDGCSILHFGTHGETDDQRPLFSRLVMAKDRENDGYLHAYEIFNKELNADLAVLSACKTGQGKILDGEGALSLAHAFSYAGVPSTVMTLWEVDEKVTAEILKNFYSFLDEGMSKSDALHTAKLEFLSTASDQLQSPYYWGGLALIGNDAPLISRSSSSNYLYYTAGILVLLIIGVLWRRRPA